jgi:hypothetical protein
MARVEGVAYPRMDCSPTWPPRFAGAVFFVGGVPFLSLPARLSGARHRWISLSLPAPAAPSAALSVRKISPLTDARDILETCLKGMAAPNCRYGR